MNAQATAPGSLPLHEIHLPPDPSWWPPAPGWWWLVGALCVAALAGYGLYRRQRSRRRWQARVLAEMRQLAERHAHDDAAYATALHQLLRRAARCYAVDAQHLQGQAWRGVLAQVAVETATLETLMTLEARMYRRHAPFDRSQVEAAAQRWLKAAWRQVHRRETGHA